MPEARQLESYGKGLTDEQISLKTKLIEDSSILFGTVDPFLIELAADFCVRSPEEATRVRLTREWDKLESLHNEQALTALHKKLC